MKSFNHYLEEFGEIGVVEFVTKGVVGISGLPSLKPEEIVIFESGQIGQTLILNQDSAEILLFDDNPPKSGTKAARTNERLSIPAGKELLGQLIDPLGHPIGQIKSFAKSLETRSLYKEPPGIEERVSITAPLYTGVVLTDLLLPLGQGQRELVIGDRKIGKTSFLLQTVLNQARMGTICIWAIIGKKRREIKQIQEFFENQKVMDKVIIVAASAEDSAGLIYATPYSAIALAEYFREINQNSLVVLDDLTTHSKFYREFSLLSRRFPGREAYPVDIFFTHASLMERGGNFKTDGKSVSITILPIAETNEGDLSGYIQTNLMSMTDGHLYFDKDLFSKGKRPAINPFLSVTRVGRQTQTPLLRDIGREIIAFLVNFQKLSSLVHFGAELTDEVKKIIAKGETINIFFDQKADEFIPINIAVFALSCIWGDRQPDYKNIVMKYQKEKKFKIAVDEIVAKSQTFAELVEKVTIFNF